MRAEPGLGSANEIPPVSPKQAPGARSTSWRSEAYQPNQDQIHCHHDRLEELLEELLELLDEELLELEGGLLTVTVRWSEVTLPAVSVARTVIRAEAPAGRLLRDLLPDHEPLA